MKLGSSSAYTAIFVVGGMLFAPLTGCAPAQPATLEVRLPESVDLKRLNDEQVGLLQMSARVVGHADGQMQVHVDEQGALGLSGALSLPAITQTTDVDIVFELTGAFDAQSERILLGRCADTVTLQPNTANRPSVECVLDIGQTLSPSFDLNRNGRSNLLDLLDLQIDPAAVDGFAVAAPSTLQFPSGIQLGDYAQQVIVIENNAPNALSGRDGGPLTVRVVGAPGLALSQFDGEQTADRAPVRELILDDIPPFEERFIAVSFAPSNDFFTTGTVTLDGADVVTGVPVGARVKVIGNADGTLREPPESVTSPDSVTLPVAGDDEPVLAPAFPMDALYSGLAVNGVGEDGESTVLVPSGRRLTLPAEDGRPRSVPVDAAFSVSIAAGARLSATLSSVVDPATGRRADLDLAFVPLADDGSLDVQSPLVQYRPVPGPSAEGVELFNATDTPLQGVLTLGHYSDVDLRAPKVPGALVDATGAEGTPFALSATVFSGPVFADVDPIVPRVGVYEGGNDVVVRGTGFDEHAVVQIDGVPGLNPRFQAGELYDTITVQVPPGQPSALQGEVTLVVQNPSVAEGGDGQAATLPAAYRYQPPAPRISEVLPLAAGRQSTVRLGIQGAFFAQGTSRPRLVFVQGATETVIAQADGAADDPTCATPQIDVSGNRLDVCFQADMQAGPSALTVQNPTRDGTWTVSNAVSFQWLEEAGDNPVVTAVTAERPGAGDVELALDGTGDGAVSIDGEQIRVEGTGFRVGMRASLEGALLPLALAGEQEGGFTEAVFQAPRRAPGVVEVRFVNADGTSTALMLKYAIPTPAVQPLAVAEGTSLGGSLIAVSGSGFAERVEVAFAPPDAPDTRLAATSVSRLSSTSLLVATPPLPNPASGGAGMLIVSNGEGQTASVPFVFVAPTAPPPRIDAVSPAVVSHTSGERITVTGANFVGGENPTRVTVAGVAVDATVVPSELVFRMPGADAIPTGNVVIAIRNPDEQTAIASVTVVPSTVPSRIFDVSPSVLVTGSTAAMELSGVGFAESGWALIESAAESDGPRIVSTALDMAGEPLITQPIDVVRVDGHTIRPTGAPAAALPVGTYAYRLSVRNQLGEVFRLRSPDFVVRDQAWVPVRSTVQGVVPSGEISVAYQPLGGVDGRVPAAELEFLAADGTSLGRVTANTTSQDGALVFAAPLTAFTDVPVENRGDVARVRAVLGPTLLPAVQVVWPRLDALLTDAQPYFERALSPVGLGQDLAPQGVTLSCVVAGVPSAPCTIDASTPGRVDMTTTAPFVEDAASGLCLVYTSAATPLMQTCGTLPAPRLDIGRAAPATLGRYTDLAEVQVSVELHTPLAADAFALEIAGSRVDAVREGDHVRAPWPAAVDLASLDRAPVVLVATLGGVERREDAGDIVVVEAPDVDGVAAHRVAPHELSVWGTHRDGAVHLVFSGAFDPIRLAGATVRFSSAGRSEDVVLDAQDVTPTSVDVQWVPSDAMRVPGVVSVSLVEDAAQTPWPSVELVQPDLALARAASLGTLTAGAGGRLLLSGARIGEGRVPACRPVHRLGFFPGASGCSAESVGADGLILSLHGQGFEHGGDVSIEFDFGSAPDFAAPVAVMYPDVQALAVGRLQPQQVPADTPLDQIVFRLQEDPASPPGTLPMVLTGAPVVEAHLRIGPYRLPVNCLSVECTAAGAADQALPLGEYTAALEVGFVADDPHPAIVALLDVVHAAPSSPAGETPVVYGVRDAVSTMGAMRGGLDGIVRVSYGGEHLDQLGLASALIYRVDQGPGTPLMPVVGPAVFLDGPMLMHVDFEMAAPLDPGVSYGVQVTSEDGSIVMQLPAFEPVPPVVTVATPLGDAEAYRDAHWLVQGTHLAASQMTGCTVPGTGASCVVVQKSDTVAVLDISAPPLTPSQHLDVELTYHKGNVAFSTPPVVGLRGDDELTPRHLPADTPLLGESIRVNSAALLAVMAQPDVTGVELNIAGVIMTAVADASDVRFDFPVVQLAEGLHPAMVTVAFNGGETYSQNFGDVRIEPVQGPPAGGCDTGVPCAEGTICQVHSGTGSSGCYPMEPCDDDEAAALNCGPRRCARLPAGEGEGQFVALCAEAPCSLSCGAGDVCMAFLDNTEACVPGCDSDADCGTGVCRKLGEAAGCLEILEEDHPNCPAGQSSRLIGFPGSTTCLPEVVCDGTNVGASCGMNQRCGASLCEAYPEVVFALQPTYPIAQSGGAQPVLQIPLGARSGTPAQLLDVSASSPSGFAFNNIPALPYEIPQDVPFSLQGAVPSELPSTVDVVLEYDAPQAGRRLYRFELTHAQCDDPEPNDGYMLADDPGFALRTATLCGVGDDDWFAFSTLPGEAGHNTAVYVKSDTGDRLDVDVWCSDSALDLMAPPTVSHAAVTEVDIVPTNTLGPQSCRLRVRGADGQSSGSYRVQASQLAAVEAMFPPELIVAGPGIIQTVELEVSNWSPLDRLSLKDAGWADAARIVKIEELRPGRLQVALEFADCSKSGPISWATERAPGDYPVTRIHGLMSAPRDLAILEVVSNPQVDIDGQPPPAGFNTGANGISPASDAYVLLGNPARCAIPSADLAAHRVAYVGQTPFASMTIDDGLRDPACGAPGSDLPEGCTIVKRLPLTAVDPALHVALQRDDTGALLESWVLGSDGVPFSTGIGAGSSAVQRPFVCMDTPAEDPRLGPGAVLPPRYSRTCAQAETNCADSVDDDLDGLMDCADPDCAAACLSPENCTEDLDMNGNGLVGCQDPACAGHAVCVGVDPVVHGGPGPIVGPPVGP